MIGLPTLIDASNCTQKQPLHHFKSESVSGIHLYWVPKEFCLYIYSGILPKEPLFLVATTSFNLPFIKGTVEATCFIYFTLVPASMTYNVYMLSSSRSWLLNLPQELAIMHMPTMHALLYCRLAPDRSLASSEVSLANFAHTVSVLG